MRLNTEKILLAPCPALGVSWRTVRKLVTRQANFPCRMLCEDSNPCCVTASGMDFMRYTDYLRTEHWQILRLAALKRYGCKCSICKSTKNLEVHHKIYRETYWDSLVQDLQVLCHACHQEEHGFAAPLRLSEPKKRKLAKQEEREIIRKTRGPKRSEEIRSGSFVSNSGRLIFDPK